MNFHSIEEVNTEESTRTPVLVVRHGRGRTGGSTFLDFLIQRARQAGRPVIIGDGDRGNATLAHLYPPTSEGGAVQPKSDEAADVSDWIDDLASTMLETRSSLVLDLGGGDQVLAEHAQGGSLPGLCEEGGVEPLAVYVIGPDLEDFEHVYKIFKAGYFKTSRGLLIMNEALVRAGKNAGGAFDHIIEHPGFDEMMETVRQLRMPRLDCMVTLRNAQLSFTEVLEQRAGFGKALSLSHQYRVKTWVNNIERQIQTLGIEEWLP